jgi:hypothetical protein
MIEGTSRRRGTNQLLIRVPQRVFQKGFLLQSFEYSRQWKTGKPRSEEVWGQLPQAIKVLGMWRASSQEELPTFEFNKQNCCS